MKQGSDTSEVDRLKADYSVRIDNPFANEWVSAFVFAICLTVMADVREHSNDVHGFHFWIYWGALLCAFLAAMAASKHAGRLAGYADGYLDGRKAAGTREA